VGQSFGFASELPLGPELALLPMNHREFFAIPRRVANLPYGKIFPDLVGNLPPWNIRQ
jgi:hypothetical protein